MTAHHRIEKISAAGLTVSVCTLGVVAYTAMTSNSIALLADLCNSALEFTADLVAFATFRLLRSKRFSRLEYGLGKFENVAGLLIGILMVLGALGLVFLTIARFRSPEELEGSGVWAAIIGMVVLGGINAWMFSRTRHLAGEHSTPLLETQANLFRTKMATDLVIATALIGGSLIGAEWGHNLDPIASVVIIVIMLNEAWHLISDSLQDLVDQAINETMQMVVNRHLIRYFDSYERLEQVRSRKSGGDVFIDICLAFKPDATLGQLQPLIADLQSGIEKEIPRSRVTVVARAAA
jgi:cation diffusion facilitator family transporter